MGVGAGSAHLVAGHCPAHEQLEQRLAQFVGMPDALLFSTGYMANLAVLTALLGRGDAVFADRLNHASLNDGCLLARANSVVIPIKTCDGWKAAGRQPARRKLIAVDAVFSMDGDLAPVPCCWRWPSATMPGCIWMMPMGSACSAARAGKSGGIGGCSRRD